MSSTPSPDAGAIGEGFLAAWSGARGGESAVTVGGALVEALARCREAWSGLEIDPLRFARFAAERTPAEGTAVDGIAALRLADLYLACGCVDGLPAAIERFEACCIEPVPRFLARLKPSHALVDEVRQALRARMLVSDGGLPPRIRQYGGRGSLEAWVRVAAVRLALSARESDRGRVSTDEDLESAVLAGAAPGRGFESEFLKARYRQDVAAVFRESLLALEARARLLLRLHYVEGMTPAAIGQLYSVHRTTAQRWIETAESDLLARVREGLGRRLQLSATECDSILGLLRSQLDVSLSPLLADSSKR